MYHISIKHSDKIAYFVYKQSTHESPKLIELLYRGVDDEIADSIYEYLDLSHADTLAYVPYGYGEAYMKIIYSHNTNMLEDCILPVEFSNIAEKDALLVGKFISYDSDYWNQWNNRNFLELGIKQGRELYEKMLLLVIENSCRISVKERKILHLGR